MTDTDRIAPTQQALAEALALSTEILRNIELGELTLTNIAFKASRLARLLNEFDIQNIMRYEASGYPITPNGVTPDIWRLAVMAGRQNIDPKSESATDTIYIESITSLEESIQASHVALSVTADPPVSISSANPNQVVLPIRGNVDERVAIQRNRSAAVHKLATRRGFIYDHVLRWNYELKFSGIADDIFTRIRGTVDRRIGQIIPDSTNKFSAVYEGLLSENSENWSNSVHSCRRILQDLADALFPSTDDERETIIEGKPLKLKLGPDQYKNRIMAFVEDHSTSGRFREIVGSHLSYLGERLDSVFRAAQKGSHDVVTKKEADRYAVYTYLLVGDILELLESDQSPADYQANA